MNTRLKTEAASVLLALSRHKATLCTAESCTGGLVSAALTAIPGSSAGFERGYVTYSNAAKQACLGVPHSVLEETGAVSESTAQAMAEGALQHSQADYALAITGLAGPEGGTADKPVGTVCFAWAGKDKSTHTATHQFGGDREAVRLQAALTALRGVERVLA